MLDKIQLHISREEWMEAITLLDEVMTVDPSNTWALFMFGQVMLSTGKESVAYPIYQLCALMEPNRPEILINLGKAAGELCLFGDEKTYFNKALSLAEKQNNKTSIVLATQNIATNAIHLGEYDEAIHWAKKALEYEESPQSHIDLGFAYLAKKDYENGWKNYNYGIDYQESRMTKQYKGEPKWDGSPGSRLVLYGDQGLGDQILFSSTVRDIRKISKQVTIHVNKKLAGLLERSYLVKAYGYGDNSWIESTPIEHSCMMSKTMEWFRNDIHKISGKPFLIADPRRRLQWRALLDSMGEKPKVGIAWTGGAHKTGSSTRSTTLETLLPILSKDIDWINLEYKDRTDEIERFHMEHGIKVHDFSWALRTDDYDDTAALVNELDLVISVPTSIVHLAGGLGVPCWCILQPKPHCFFGEEGETMPFYDSVRLFRREKDWEILENVAGELNALFGSDPGRSGARRDLSGSGKLGTDGCIEKGEVPAHRSVHH